MSVAEPRHHRVGVAGGEIFVRDEGEPNAPCVVLAHSIMTDAGMWDGQVALLQGLGLRVLRPDSRGHGRSTAAGAAFTLADLAQDVIAILDALAVERAHFIGLSLGGIVGFDLGVDHAQRLLSLVICDARADAPPESVQPWDARIQVAAEHGMAALAEPTLARWFGEDFLRQNDPALQSIRKMITATSVAGFQATARALQSFDYRQRLPQIGLPATLVVGERDGVLPGVMRELAAQIPGAAFQVIADAGHLPNIEQCRSFNACLSGHFGRVA